MAKQKKTTKPVIYTEEFVLKELDNIYKQAKRNKELIVLGEIFENKDYSIQRFSEWARKFEFDEKISEPIKKIKEIFENRVNIGGLKNKLNPTMVIFNLKNNYGWRDRTEIEQSDKAERNPYKDLTEEELDAKLIELTKKLEG